MIPHMCVYLLFCVGYIIYYIFFIVVIRCVFIRICVCILVNICFCCIAVVLFLNIAMPIVFVSFLIVFVFIFITNRSLNIFMIFQREYNRVLVPTLGLNKINEINPHRTQPSP